MPEQGNPGDKKDPFDSTAIPENWLLIVGDAKKTSQLFHIEDGFDPREVRSPFARTFFTGVPTTILWNLARNAVAPNPLHACAPPAELVAEIDDWYKAKRTRPDLRRLCYLKAPFRLPTVAVKGQTVKRE